MYSIFQQEVTGHHSLDQLTFLVSAGMRCEVWGARIREKEQRKRTRYPLCTANSEKRIAKRVWGMGYEVWGMGYDVWRKEKDKGETVLKSHPERSKSINRSLPNRGTPGWCRPARVRDRHWSSPDKRTNLHTPAQKAFPKRRSA